MLQEVKQPARRSSVGQPPREDVVPNAIHGRDLYPISPQFSSKSKTNSKEPDEETRTHPGHNSSSPLRLLSLPDDVPIGDRVPHGPDGDGPEDLGEDADGLGVGVHLVRGLVEVHRCR
jgi:hypothetical protein